MSETLFFGFQGQFHKYVFFTKFFHKMYDYIQIVHLPVPQQGQLGV